MTQAFEAAVHEAFGTGDLARGSAAEVAKRFAEAIERVSTQPLVHDYGRLWRYDPASGIWTPVDDAAITRMTTLIDGTACIESAKPLKVGGGLWRDVGAALNATPHDRSGFFARPAQGLSFRNGFVLVTKDGLQMLPHSAQHRQRHCYPMDWDPDAPCERWWQALDEWGLLENEQSFSAQAFGTGLIGLAARGEKALILLGSGRNGKSVYMKVLQGLFPDEWRSSVPMTRLSDRFGASQLFGKRLNSLADAPNDDFIASSGFKAIVSGDEIQAEQKYRDGFKFVPECLLAYSFNPPRPAITDASDGFWRRIAVIEFRQNFDGAARIEGLADIILEAERPGIMAWALNGAVDRLRRGWAPCGVDVTAEWRHAEDPIGLWLADIDAQHDDWTPAHELFTHFKRWAEPRNRLRGLGDRTFYERLHQHLAQTLGGDVKIRTKAGFQYRVVLPTRWPS
ncbi:MAG: hypothetical protein CVU56_24525 [Deltaproteobacteria bacterium HGW-Deltaproteobacteria-14]|jgi:putative DNA primase/helicase|nr:MAG: hypothetical protein CVU56_24525 [Deltaproteobacteria bacterium HGW-Deltaproteobacteria-14]